MGPRNRSPPREGEPVSSTIVRQVAAHEGVDPTDLEPPLYDVVDPDALDALLDSSRTNAESFSLCVEFDYHGYEISVQQDGEFQLTSVSGSDGTGSPD